METKEKMCSTFSGGNPEEEEDQQEEKEDEVLGKNEKGGKVGEGGLARNGP